MFAFCKRLIDADRDLAAHAQHVLDLAPVAHREIERALTKTVEGDDWRRRLGDERVRARTISPSRSSTRAGSVP